MKPFICQMNCKVIAPSEWCKLNPAWFGGNGGFRSSGKNVNIFQLTYFIIQEQQEKEKKRPRCLTHFSVNTV